jgi:predicted SnoaL-like aldol condensation-catalyzing enzyme
MDSATTAKARCPLLLKEKAKMKKSLKKIFQHGLICGALTAATSTTVLADSNTQKTQVVALLKSIETGEPAPVSYINPKKYIQHNLAIGDGLAGFGAALKALPEGSAKANTVRVFRDGDYVFTHTEYNFFGPKIGFDIFRFEHGKIVEHWDNLQESPKQPNPSGHTMTDGPTVATDLHKTAANKKIVRSFVADWRQIERLGCSPGSDGKTRRDDEV